MKINKLVIDRAKWLRGKPQEAALLEPKTGCMCCLGFLAIACGYDPEDIKNEGEPSGMLKAPDDNLWPSWIVKVSEEDQEDDDGYPMPPEIKFIDSETTGFLIEANDSKDLSETTREAAISQLFLKHGVTVEFVGE